MKLPIIVSAGMITATVAYNAYALTCGAQPSCDSLGYKYTDATTDCLNEPLKCPFNSSYFNCVKKVDAVNLLAPNYSSYKSLSTNGTTYTVGSGTLASYSCGWVSFQSENTNINNSESIWKINGKIVGKQRGLGGKWADYNSAIFLLSKGNTFSLTGYADKEYLYFYPCKGY